MPNIVHFSAQEMYTKYDICLAFARVLGVEDAVKENMEAVTAGPGPTETVRPKDCHLANVRLCHRSREEGTDDSSRPSWRAWESIVKPSRSDHGGQHDSVREDTCVEHD